ncbi:hypothetical protein K493DRAFT_379375, partial [Basidiobolus meristosporus CBS 931.73]
ARIANQLPSTLHCSLSLIPLHLNQHPDGISFVHSVRMSHPSNSSPMTQDSTWLGYLKSEGMPTQQIPQSSDPTLPKIPLCESDQAAYLVYSDSHIPSSHQYLASTMSDRFDHSFPSDMMPLDSCQFQSWLSRGAQGNTKNVETKYHSPPPHSVVHHYPTQNPELLPVISSHSFHENTMPEYSYSLNSVSPNRSHSLTPSRPITYTLVHFLVSEYLMESSSEIHQHNSSFSSLSSESQEYHHHPNLRPQPSHNLSINPHAKPNPSHSTSIPSPVPTPTTASPHNDYHHNHDLRSVSPNLNPVLVNNLQPLVQQPAGLISNQSSLSMAEGEDGTSTRRSSIAQQASPRRKSSDLRPILPDGPTTNSETDPETCTSSQQKSVTIL